MGFRVRANILRIFTAIVMISLATAIAAQNRQQIGSGDGQPIFQPKDRTTSPDTALQHRCDDIKGQITHIARETAKRQFAVTVTPDEVAQLSTQYWAQHDAAAEVQKHKQQQPSAAAITMDGWKQAHEAQFQKIMADRKLDDSVDAQIAAGDPQFRTYLNEYHQRGTWVTPVEYQSDMPQADAAYLKQKRSEFWQSRYAQQQVTLNDPALADQCQLGSTLGVKIAGAKGL
jgi:hypothetical protein